MLRRLLNLAKFAGCYDRFLQLREHYNLKWSTGNETIDAFQRFFDDNKTLGKMLMDLKGSIGALPKNYAAFLCSLHLQACCIHVSS